MQNQAQAVSVGEAILTASPRALTHPPCRTAALPRTAAGLFCDTLMANQPQTRYLITGGAGFIGSHLAERLVRDGHHVVLLDDLSTGRVENIVGILGNPGVQFVRDSVENE